MRLTRSLGFEALFFIKSPIQDTSLLKEETPIPTNSIFDILVPQTVSLKSPLLPNQTPLPYAIRVNGPYTKESEKEWYTIIYKWYK